MDERELSKLFRDAAGTPPPASFDHDDVLGASRRATARRRGALAGGSLLGVAALSGGLVLGAQLSGPSQPAAPAAPPPAAALAPDAGGRAAPQPMSTPSSATPGSGGRAAVAASCGPADPVLAAELTDALADLTAPTGPAVPLPETCPPQSRAVGVPVAGGTIYLVVSPAIVGTGEGSSVGPDGARSYTVTAGNGNLVSVLSVPAGGQPPAPLHEHVDDLAQEIAAQL